jgi:hypothetical protein
MDPTSWGLTIEIIVGEHPGNIGAGGIGDGLGGAGAPAFTSPTSVFGTGGGGGTSLVLNVFIDFRQGVSLDAQEGFSRNT